MGSVNSPRNAAPRSLATSPFARSEPVARELLVLTVGDRVTHDSFGLGRVVTAGCSHVTVDFGGGQVRSLACDSRELTKI